MTITGVDLYQGNSFAPAADSNVGFVFLKASEGRSLRDTQFGSRWTLLGAAGKVRGAYHFPNFWNSPATDFAFFASIVGPVLRAGDLLALDFEGDNDTHTWAQRTSWKNEWLRLAKERFSGHRIGVYCSVSWWHGTDNNHGDFLWIADYTTAGAPRVATPWTFHQYSTSGGIDHDVANFPSLQALRAWACGATAPATSPAQSAQEDDMSLTPQDVQAIAQAVLGYTTNVPAIDQQLSVATAVYQSAAESTLTLRVVQDLQAQLAALKTAPPQGPPPVAVDGAAVAAALAANPTFVTNLAAALAAEAGKRLAA